MNVLRINWTMYEIYLKTVKKNFKVMQEETGV